VFLGLVSPAVLQPVLRPVLRLCWLGSRKPQLLAHIYAGGRAGAWPARLRVNLWAQPRAPPQAQPQEQWEEQTLALVPVSEPGQRSELARG
jgi:hypothetical protein